MRSHLFSAVRLALVAGLLTLSLGCSFQDQSRVMVEVRYIEIPVNNIDRAVLFYEEVFGVKLERVIVDGYPMAHFPSLGERIGADVTLAQGDGYVPSKAGAIVYFNVPDIDGVLSRALARGAALLYPKKEVAPGSWVAEFEDSEGNRIALNQRRS